MSSTSIRYEIFPQMKLYDNMDSGGFSPYAMLSGPKNYRSKQINTDSLGFRKSLNTNIEYSVSQIKHYDKINFLVGGSTVFGVGSTSDATTISSNLSKASKEIWLNFGIRGANSFQELIHLINILNKANKIGKVVFLSGINDLYMSLINNELSDFDNGFGTKFNKIGSYHPYHQSFAIFFSNLYNKDLNSMIKRRKLNMLFSFFSSEKPSTNILNFNKRVEVFLNIYSRNFKLYRGLKESFKIDQISFILQPLFDWTNKETSSNEFQVLNYLNNLQRDSPWVKFKNSLKNPKLKQKISREIKSFAARENIRFLNSNEFFVNLKDDCFVDSVHLNDTGNRVITDKILKL